MKRIILLFVGALFLFSSCTVHNIMSSNVHANNTQVVLSQKNFKVLDKVYGEASAIYIFGIGGMTKKSLVALARDRMLESADIVGDSKAIINEHVEVRSSVYFVYTNVTVSVSGHVVEFLE